MPDVGRDRPLTRDAVERDIVRVRLEEGQELGRGFGVIELDREDGVADDASRPDVVDGQLREAARHPVVEDLACSFVAPDGGADDAVRELEREGRGVVLRRLLHQWEELVVAAGERADHEQLAGEEREGVGRTDLHTELEVRGRDCLGFGEAARHRRRERLGHADRPAQSWLADGARRRPELREAASGRHMIGGFDRDVVGREMGAEFESRVAGCFGNCDRFRRDAGPDVAAPGSHSPQSTPGAMRASNVGS